MMKSISLLILFMILGGCASTPGSFAYEVAKASERSKYTQDTVVTQDQMNALEEAGGNLEKSATDIKFNDAGLTYGFGQATDAATVGAIAGSAAGLLDAMSGLDMAMFGAMAIFDSSHAERRKLYYNDAFIIREQSPQLNNTGKKGFIQDLNDIGPDVIEAIKRLAADNNWETHPNWSSGIPKLGLSAGYTGTGICSKDTVLTFFTRALEKTALEKGYGTAHGILEKDRVGMPGQGVLNVTGFGFMPACAPENGIESRRELNQLPAPLSWPLALKMSTLDEVPEEVYFYLPPSESAFPVPALVNKGKVYWMAKVK